MLLSELVIRDTDSVNCARLRCFFDMNSRAHALLSFANDSNITYVRCILDVFLCNKHTCSYIHKHDKGVVYVVLEIEIVSYPHGTALGFFFALERTRPPQLPGVASKAALTSY